jgi:hypothetical protein
MRKEVSASGDMAWQYGTHVDELDIPDGRIKQPGKSLEHQRPCSRQRHYLRGKEKETENQYLITLRKEQGRWKEVAVCLFRR